MSKLNLHLHSRYSDGIFTPEQIMKESEKRGFQFISITDHNEIRGTLEALKFNSPVTNIPGIELFFLYDKKLTEMLVYFPTEKEIIGFYNEFIGHKILPRVKSPKELELLLAKYNGKAIKPHPLHYKGAILNDFNLKAKMLESENGMVKSKFIKVPDSSFGGADLHSDLGSLDCYTISTDVMKIEDFFEKNDARFTAVNNYKLTIWKKIISKLINIFMVPKYIFMQIFDRKILKKPLISERP